MDDDDDDDDDRSYDLMCILEANYRTLGIEERGKAVL
jgi:hypothetical protein